MFSGIIEDIGQVKYISEDREVIAIETSFTDIKMGESISCSGVCLTVSKIQKPVFFSDLSPETLKKTTLSKLKVGDYINLEKSLKIGEENFLSIINVSRGILTNKNKQVEDIKEATLNYTLKIRDLIWKVKK